jgi:hypothetical protein
MPCFQKLGSFSNPSYPRVGDFMARWNISRDYDCAARLGLSMASLSGRPNDALTPSLHDSVVSIRYCFTTSRLRAVRAQ